MRICFEDILDAIIISIKNRGVLIFLMFTFVYLSFGTTPILAAKKRVWGKTVVTTTTRNNPLAISARLTGWKQYLSLSFRGVASTKEISYELSYDSNGIGQQAGGMVNVADGNVTKNLFLGTCSHNACVSHKNVSNVRLKVAYLTTGGQNITKNYKVKY